MTITNDNSSDDFIDDEDAESDDWEYKPQRRKRSKICNTSKKHKFRNVELSHVMFNNWQVLTPSVKVYHQRLSETI